jgi:hypothetical protein
MRIRIIRMMMMILEDDSSNQIVAHVGFYGQSS